MKKLFFVRQSSVVPETKNSIKFREFYFLKWLTQDSKVSKEFSVSFIHSSFDHYKKNKKESFKSFFPNISEFLLGAIWYKRNTSILRILDAWYFSIQLFFLLLLKTNKHSIVICTLPTPESCFIVSLVRRLKKFNFIIDFRDGWPGALVTNSKIKTYLFDKYCMFLISFSLKKTNKILSMSDSLINYYKQRHPKQMLDKKMFTLSNPVVEEKIIKTQRYDHLIDDNYVVFFAGTLNDQFTFDPLLECIEEISKIENIIVLIAGEGSRLEFLQNQFREFKFVKFLRKIPSEDCKYIMSRADVLFSFYGLDIFKGHLTNKIIEYSAFKSKIIHNLGDFRINEELFSVGESIKDSFHETLLNYDDNLSDKNKLKIRKYFKEELSRELFKQSLIYDKS